MALIGVNGGLIGNQRSANVNTAPGVWTANEQVVLRRAAVWPLSGDPYFAYNTLLLHMDGSNGSTTFTDNSPAGITLTANGNAQISTAQSKFGGASALFDGVDDNLKITTAQPGFAFGLGDFTIEFWLYYTGGTGYVFFFLNNGANANYVGYGLNTGTKNPWVWNNTNVLTTSTSVTNNVWQHHAVVRRNGTLSIYLDGVSIGTTTWNVDLGQTAPFVIGSNAAIPPTQETSGYIDEFRITKGIARYTANFTPPFVPFLNNGLTGNDPYFATTSLLLHMNGSNNSTTFTDSSLNALSATVNGNAKISTAQSKFGGASALFDGTTDYVTFATSSLFALFAGDFTVEFWVYLNGSVNNQAILQLSTSATERANVSVVSNLIVVYTETAGSGATRISGTAPSTSTWHHVAWTRDGTTSRLFLNGTSLGTAASVPYPSGNMNVSVGANDRTSGGTCLDGYVDEVRITKGIARYTANFTPPAAPFPDA